MKIALPLTATDEFSPHYGAAAKFAVFDIDPRKQAVHRRMIVIPLESEPCAWPPLLQAAGVKLVLAAGMGSGARHRMAEHGVEVIAGVSPAGPDELVTAWLTGRLVRSENTCDGHEDARHHQEGDCRCAR